MPPEDDLSDHDLPPPKTNNPPSILDDMEPEISEEELPEVQVEQEELRQTVPIGEDTWKREFLVYEGQLNEKKRRKTGLGRMSHYVKFS